MQRDFLETRAASAPRSATTSASFDRTIAPTARVLAACRAAGMLVVHTREGHRPDLTDLAPAKYRRGNFATGIGDPGPMGRILVRGEPGPRHHPGAVRRPPASRWSTSPARARSTPPTWRPSCRGRGIARLLVCGVTTEVCVNTTVREANDRGYDCLVLADCCGSYFPEFQAMGLAMIKAQGGIFGWVAKKFWPRSA
jgi:nicotinamidase-related amidase